MTAQAGERLVYEGETYSMCTEPLGEYFRLGGRDPGFTSTMTALWRGYIGEWEVIDDRLYLASIEGTLADGTEASLESVFPGFPDRAFAHWFSGVIRIPQGKMLEYVHMGYESVYERDLILEFEKGVLTRKDIKHNGVSESDSAPEGYGIGGFTVFPRDTGPDDEQ